MKITEDKIEKEHRSRSKKFRKADTEKILDKEDNLFSKFLNISNLQEYFVDFKDLFSLLKDWYQGKYKDVPWIAISSIGGTLLYVLSPIDLIPDWIPFVGYLDDAFIFAKCLEFVRVDLEKYRNWRIGDPAVNRQEVLDS